MRCAGKDPLGYLMPYMVRGKMLVQELWKKPWGWDEEIPDKGEDSLYVQHVRWRKEIDDLPRVHLPRCYLPQHFDPVNVSYQLHVFADASEKAYGAVAYLRATAQSGEVGVGFVMARSRLAPKRVQTIPRLELQAALCGAELAELLEDELKLNLSVTCWSDSTTVLSWITSESCRYNRFVGARIAEIQRLTDHAIWRYVGTAQNPADDLTRGLTLSELTTKSRWSAPSFLSGPEEEWPSLPSTKQHDDEVELKGSPFAALTISNPGEDPEIDATQYASWDNLVEAYGRTLCEAKGETNLDFLTADQRVEAEHALFRKVQAESFPEDLAALAAGSPVQRNSRLAKLAPEIDADTRLIRVGGRLRRAELDLDVKHPVVLDCRHQIVRLLIRNADERLGHPGTGTVLADMRRRFWLLRGRQSIRSLQSRCAGCLRQRGQPSVPKMADMPSARLRIGKPAFYSTGVDCFGPYTVTMGRRSERRWGIIWKCMTTRAVYLDLLESLDADAFLLAFNRFRSRRGTPHEVLCDNGTNFRGGLSELKKAFSEMESDLRKRLAQHKVRFRFNPPSAPHFGGTWEREIRSVKTALYAILGNRSVGASVLYTCLVEVEALLNSKPLTYVSSDIADPDPITPFMLLMGRRDHAPVQVVYPDRDVLSRRRWRQCQALMQRFWREFVQSYLSAMQARQKWHSENDNLSIGDVVLMVDPQQRRASWPLAKVTEVLPGADKRVRIVRVQVGDRIYTRPVARLIRLPSETTCDTGPEAATLPEPEPT